MSGFGYYFQQLLPLLRGLAIAQSTVLLNGAIATTDGEWVSVAGRKNLTVQVKGITTATCKIHLSNRTQVQNTDSEFVHTLLTADSLIAIAGPVRWLKVSVSDYTSGTISAFLEAM